MLLSSVRAWPCSCWIAPEVVRAASQAVAAIEAPATSADRTNSRRRRLRRIGARGQLVADAVDRHQPRRAARLVLDLLPQVHHVDVDGALGDVAVEAVHGREPL